MKIKFKVCGVKWTAKILSKGKYKDHCEDGTLSLAVTKASKREIHFLGYGLSLRTVIHEVFHAHAHYLHINSTNNIKLNDFEEIIAEMLEVRIFEIIKTSNKILKKFNKK